jgi:hypothetical protein
MPDHRPQSRYVRRDTHAGNPTGLGRSRGRPRRPVGSGELGDRLLDQRGPVSYRAGGHLNEVEPQVAIDLLVQLLEDEGVLETDPRGGGIPQVVTVHSLDPLRPWKAEQLGGGTRSRPRRSGSRRAAQTAELTP